MSQSPPVPQITSLISLPPTKTDPVIVATTKDRLRITADSDNSSKKNLVSDTPGVQLSGTGKLLNYWDGLPEEEYTLTLRQWWEIIPNSYNILNHDDKFKRTFTVSTGYSETATQTLAAELGVEAEGLSAKLSAEFSTSITLTTQTTETEEHEYTNDQSGKIRVIALYKLMSEIVALDKNGVVIPASRGRKGEVEWYDHDGYTSGAFLYYESVQQNLSSIFTSVASAYFPIPTSGYYAIPSSSYIAIPS